AARAGGLRRGVPPRPGPPSLILAVPSTGFRTAAAVGAGDDLEEMTVGVAEVDPTAPVVVIDLARPHLAGVGPVVQPPLFDTAEDRVEVVLADEERVVLGHDLGTGLVVVE